MQHGRRLAADDRADVGFQQAGTEDDQQQAEREARAGGYGMIDDCVHGRIPCTLIVRILSLPPPVHRCVAVTCLERESGGFKARAIRLHPLVHFVLAVCRVVHDIGVRSHVVRL